MIDFAKLEADITARVADASAEILETIRIETLGKAGSISALLKSLGSMSPDERREIGPLINGLRDRVSASLAERKAALETAVLAARLESERVDLSLPAAPRGSHARR